jgi:hypothetical protein
VPPPVRPASNGGTRSPRTIQRALSFEGKFKTDGSSFQQALLALFHLDQEDLTPEEVQKYGLDRLIVPLLPKLLGLQGTDLVFDAKRPWDKNSERQVSQGVAGAVTELFVKARDSGSYLDMDKKDGQRIFQERAVERFLLKVTIVLPVKGNQKVMPTTFADILQILNHELSVHAENFADLIEAYWSGRKAILKTAGTEHFEYGKDQVARYSQLRDRILPSLSGEEQETYTMREYGDKLFMNKKPADPKVFGW